MKTLRTKNQMLVDVATHLMDELEKPGSYVTGDIEGLINDLHFVVDADILFSTAERKILEKNGYKIAQKGFYATRRVNGTNVEVEKVGYSNYELTFGTKTVYSDSTDIYDLKEETRVNSRDFKRLLKDYINE